MWCEAVEPFWAANPCRKASCYQCHRERLLMCTCSPGGRDSTRPLGTEPVLVLGLKLLEFWMSAWASPSSGPVCFKTDSAQRNKFFKVSFDFNCLISFTDSKGEVSVICQHTNYFLFWECVINNIKKGIEIPDVDPSSANRKSIFGAIFAFHKLCWDAYQV